MMKAVSVAELYRDMEAYSGQEITVAGWMRTARFQSNLGFIELNDGTNFGNLQLVLDAENTADYDAISHFGAGSAIIAHGVFTLTPEMKQPFELKVTSVELEGACPSDYPLQKKRHSFEYLRQIAHLRPRTNTFAAVFRVRSLAAFAIHEFFRKRGFFYVHTPLITASDCEGAGEMFQVTTLDLNDPPKNEDGAIDYTKDFFGKRTSLTVSGQLNGEIFAHAFSRIYTFGPTFRAEESYTARHAAEFWMIEPEFCFADLADDMDLAEDMVKYVINYVLENAKQEMTFFDQFVDKGLLARLDNIVSNEFAHVSYTEAIDILLKSGKEFKYPVFWGCDLATEHERYLAEEVYKRPVFVTDYPKEIKAFYMRLNDDGKTVAAADLLVPGVGEIIGGSQREERFDVLEQRIVETGMDPADYDWYLELRKYGGTRHAGFGLGFERLIMYMTGMTNIRDVIPFPRTTGSILF